MKLTNPSNSTLDPSLKRKGPSESASTPGAGIIQLSGRNLIL